MALFGSFPAVRAQGARFSELRAAFAYVEGILTPGTEAHARIQALAAGQSHRQELASGAYAIEAAYRTKPRPDGFFETHRRHIDVQVIVAGEELMEVAAREQLKAAHPYDEAKDLVKYADTDAANVLLLSPGSAVVLWPEDGHMGSLVAHGEPVLVRKTVVKVPVPA